MKIANSKRAKPVIDAGCDSIKFSINAHNREDFKKVLVMMILTKL